MNKYIVHFRRELWDTKTIEANSVREAAVRAEGMLEDGEINCDNPNLPEIEILHPEKIEE